MKRLTESLVHRVDVFAAATLKHIHTGDPRQNLYDVGRIFIRQIRKDEILERASAVAFNFTIALFPLILFLLNTIPYIQYVIHDIDTAKILLFIQDVLPDSIYQEAENTIMDIVSRPRQSLLSIGFFLALYLATNGVVSMMTAFNAVYKTVENRGFFKTRLIAVSIILMLIICIVGSVFVMAIGSSLLYQLNELHFYSSRINYYLLTSMRFFALLSIFIIATSYIFRFAPAVHYRWKFFSTGSLSSGLLITLGFYVFSFYLNNFASYNKLYGSIGTMIAVMLWLWITSIIILVGFEINVSFDKSIQRGRRKTNS